MECDRVGNEVFIGHTARRAWAGECFTMIEAKLIEEKWSDMLNGDYLTLRKYQGDEEENVEKY